MISAMSDPLTSREVADQLDVSVRTVHRMVARGRLPVLRRFHGGYLFDRAVIDFFARTYQPRPYRRREASPYTEHERATS